MKLSVGEVRGGPLESTFYEEGKDVCLLLFFLDTPLYALNITSPARAGFNFFNA